MVSKLWLYTMSTIVKGRSYPQSLTINTSRIHVLFYLCGLVHHLYKKNHGHYRKQQGKARKIRVNCTEKKRHSLCELTRYQHGRTV